jgi:hypothetical protein
MKSRPTGSRTRTDERCQEIEALIAESGRVVIPCTGTFLRAFDAPDEEADSDPDPDPDKYSFLAILGITAEECVEYVQRRMHEGDDEFRNAWARLSSVAALGAVKASQKVAVLGEVGLNLVNSIPINSSTALATNSHNRSPCSGGGGCFAAMKGTVQSAGAKFPGVVSSFSFEGRLGVCWPESPCWLTSRFLVGVAGMPSVMPVRA